MSKIPVGQTALTLNNGEVIPQLGVGVYQVPDGKATLENLATAFELGYRHVDTAHAYENERSVGQAVGASGLDRADLWITSKLWPSEYGRGKTRSAIAAMLERLDTPYLDLLLLHQQFGDYLGAWSDMEDAVEQGLVRTIGLSNFESERLEDVLQHATIMPAVNQVECHPFYPQSQLRQRLAGAGALIESWYPLGHGATELLGHPVLQSLSEELGKTPAQIVLRWHIQQNNIIFPRATSRQHLAENMAIFDFELSAAHLERIAGLDSNTRFFNMDLETQEKVLGNFVPRD